jgi:chemotaxis protein methyltransferase CheR
MTGSSPTPGASPLAAGVPEMTDGEYRLLAGLIHKEAGIYLGSEKKLVLIARLAFRLRALGLASFSDYATRVMGDPAERTKMIDCVCTNETSFFRERWHFDFMAQTIAPAWRNSPATARSRMVRVWSAACSTGEEPYSIAMCLRHHLPIDEGWQIEISATDLSTRALKAAQDAVWPIEHAAAIPELYLRAFMLRGEGERAGQMRAGPLLRSMISFRVQNLHAAYPASAPFDLIFCRNVLIYFDKQAKVRVVERLVGMLAKGGYLFVGHAESLQAAEYGARAVAPSIYVPAAGSRKGAR